MKNKYLYSWIVLVLFLNVSCDSGFDALNTDKTNLTSLEPVLQVNNAIVNSGFNWSNSLCETTIVRQGISPFTGLLTCANVNQDNKSMTSENWNRYFGANVIRELTDAINNTDQSSNVHHMARIWRAYAFMVTTDTYGDVPYSEAGLGFSDNIIFPGYDSQEQIYTGANGILEELVDATSSLDLSQAADSRDLLYGGNVEQWKRLGNSLLLRAAMRLTKIAPDLAEQYVGIAVAGGIMHDNNDSAVIRHTSDFRNAVGTQFNGGEAANYYLDEVFINFLKDNNDPRLASIAVRYVGAESGTDQTEARADRSPDNQIGMPQGYDSNNIGRVAEEAGLSSFYAYSQIDRSTIHGTESPTYLVTHAQTQLLMGEAVVRGWIDGDASELYSEGIKAHMQQFSDYGTRTLIDQNDIDSYLQANPLEAGNELEQINTQYWVVSFMNGPEAWANFRRSGYPDLPPNPLSGDLQSEEFIRRLTYPDSEYSVNNEHLREAVNKQGPDNLNTRVWWDI